MSERTHPVRMVLVAFFLGALTQAAQANPRINVSQGLTQVGAPLAIHGYDPVEYFTEGRAVIGEAAYTIVHEGAAYRFASESNKKAFEMDPERYLPQYGGFCAFGVALGAKFDGDPRLFAIVDGKLYLNLNPAIQKKWNEDRARNIEKAQENWPRIRDKDPRELKS